MILCTLCFLLLIPLLQVNAYQKSLGLPAASATPSEVTSQVRLLKVLGCPKSLVLENFPCSPLLGASPDFAWLELRLNIGKSSSLASSLLLSLKKGLLSCVLAFGWLLLTAPYAELN